MYYMAMSEPHCYMYYMAMSEPHCYMYYMAMSERGDNIKEPPAVKRYLTHKKCKTEKNTFESTGSVSGHSERLALGVSVIQCVLELATIT